MVSNKRKGRSKAPTFQFPLFRVLAWGAVFFLTGLTLFLALRLPNHNPRQPEQSVAARNETETKSRPIEQSTLPIARQAEPDLTTGNASLHPEYEMRTDDFEAKTRAVDVALLHTLAKFGTSESSLRHRAVESREFKGQEFYYQNLTIRLNQDLFEFLAELKKNLAKYVPSASIATVKENPRDIEIAILGQPTHHLFFPLSLTPDTDQEPAVKGAKLVIIIDDLGESIAVGNELASLPFPVSFSVLPYSTHGRDVAKIARKAGRELLMHLPCEPVGYPKKANSGPGTLRINMSPAQLEQTLADDLAKLPEVDGVNNHMGSRLTTSPKAMTIVLSHLNGRGKFFVDSMTTPKSAIKEVSTKIGMRYYRRHIFLDNSEAENTILLQLQKAESLAKRTGSAIVIGHPYPETLSALERWAKTRDTKVTICKIQDI